MNLNMDISRSYFEHFRDFWIPIYRKQVIEYKLNEEKEEVLVEVLENVLKNINLDNFEKKYVLKEIQLWYLYKKYFFKKKLKIEIRKTKEIH